MTDWINNHDERVSFTIAYIGASVLLSVFVSIFWLIPMVLFHGYLEWRKAKLLDVNKALYIFSHLKFDIALIFFSLWLSIYIDATLGLLGIGTASRIAARSGAVARSGAKIIAWQRVLKGVLITADDLAKLVNGFVRLRNRERKNGSPTPHPEKLNFADYLTFGVSVSLILSMVFAPYLIGVEYSQVLDILKTDLTPWP